jgi:Glutathione-dependent formaldehyde-activating enzyme
MREAYNTGPLNTPMVAGCHCKSCQKQAGTAFAVVVAIPNSAISIQGQLKTFRDTGDRSQPVGEQRECLESVVLADFDRSVNSLCACRTLVHLYGRPIPIYAMI